MFASRNKRGTLGYQDTWWEGYLPPERSWAALKEEGALVSVLKLSFQSNLQYVRRSVVGHQEMQEHYVLQDVP